eukprot:scaffold1718_cov81-Skeletonema_dohrnii-CCMP3373.AAC.5
MSSSNSDIEEEVASENFMSMSPNSDVAEGQDTACDSDTDASDYEYEYDISADNDDDDDDDGCALILPNCGHSLCVDCFTKYVETEVGQGNADNIKCPFCNEAVTMDVIKEVVDEVSFQRLERLKDAAFVLKNPDYHHCPTPDCGNIVMCGYALGHEFPSVQEAAAAAAAPPRICDCFKCGKTSCLLCGASFHEGLTCDEYELQQREEELQRQAANIIGNAYLRFRQRPNRGRPDMDMDVEEFLGRNQSRGLLGRFAMGMRRILMVMMTQTQENDYEFELNAAESSTLGITNTSSGGVDSISTNNIKRCQQCGNGIERSSGCLHMKCRCGYEFCYKCGANLDAGSSILLCSMLHAYSSFDDKIRASFTAA